MQPTTKRGPGRPKGSVTAAPSQNVTVRIESLLVSKLDAITANRSRWIAAKIRNARTPKP